MLAAQAVAIAHRVFSLHAGVPHQVSERDQRGRPRRNVTRPVIAERRTGNGALPARTARTDGSRRVIADRLDAHGKPGNEHDASTAPQECAWAAGGNGAVGDEKAGRGETAGYEATSQNPDPRRTVQLRDQCLPGRLPTQRI